MKKKETIKVDPNIRDDDKIPGFDKKDQLARDFIKKHGLPDFCYKDKKK